MNHDVEQWQVAKRAVASERGAVAAQHVQAARAGAAMLHAGGNAADAAVAAALALTALEPWMCGLGGSGTMVVWDAKAKAATAIDFQGVLPAGIDRADYPLDPQVPDSIMGFPGVVDRRNVLGYLSISVPGAVAGLAELNRRFGKLGFDSLLGPAIQLAERGLPVDWFATLQASLAMEELSRDPAAAATYLPHGRPPMPEQYLSLGKLPETLRALAADGPESFYKGALAERLAADLAAGGSRITADDLAAYAPEVFPAMSGKHRGAEVHTAGPTSGGLRMLETLAEVERALPAPSAPSPESWKVYADAFTLAWKNHNRRIGRTTEVGGCTSHLSAVDAEGNMVALTYTLLNRFGSAVVLPRTGILMNNAVSYFDPRPGFPTSMEGGKRINASNMSPTVATRDGQALFAVGASGANHIMPATTQLTALMLDFGLDLETAFNHPRIDVGDRSSIRVDPRLGTEVREELGRHYALEIAQLLVFPKLYACPSGVSRDPASGLCRAVNDPSQPIGGGAAPAPFVLDEEAGSAGLPRP